MANQRRIQLAETLMAVALDAAQEYDSVPLVEHGCLAIVRGLALDTYRQSVLAHILMDMASLLDDPETKATDAFAVRVGN